jgi:hypothetical protein
MHSFLTRVFGLIVATLVCIESPVLAATPVAGDIVEDLAPVIQEYQSVFSSQLSAMPRYDMQLTMDSAGSTIGGEMTVSFSNETGTTLSELPFRLYPNAAYYAEGETVISAIEAAGISILPRFDDSGTVLFVDLPQPLAPGATATVALAFTTVVPRGSGGSFGILDHDVSTGRFVLADWYPIVAGWDQTGWRLEPPTEQGDPTFSATSLYDLRLTLPEDYDVIASGDETRLEDGSVEIVSGPVREFAMVAAPGLATVSAQAGDTTVLVHAGPAHQATAQHMLESAVAALDFYEASFGAYPFRELDLVETTLSLALGVSWSGVLFINQSQLALPPEATGALDFTIFHEIGHQWWGGTVGANSNDHTFMVEGLTNATAVLAQAAVHGPDAAAASLMGWVVTPYLNLLDGSGDAVADVSIFDQAATAPLSTLAYGKGALGFLAIRNQIGDAPFREALASYADAFRLGIAEPADLRAAFESASGQSLDELWSFWFDSAGVTRADVEALVPEIVASLG